MNTPPSKKRKTVHDYFASHSPRQPPQDDQTKPFHLKSLPTSVPGLSILPNYITSTEERTLLSFLATQTWRDDLSRRTIHYGGTYCLMPPRSATPDERKRIESTVLTADPIPAELGWLIDRIVDGDFYAAGARPKFCIVNEYTSTLGISAHVENFRFDEPVCALTLGDGDSMRFHELSSPHDGSVRTGKAASAPRTGRRVDVWLPSRSLLVMTGDARWKWQHEIVRGRKRRGTSGEWRRVSLTFRVEKSGQKEKVRQRTLDPPMA